MPRFQAAILLFTSIYARFSRFSVARRVSSCDPLTKTNTPEFALRIRVRKLPVSGEFDEFSLSHFRVGLTYTVPSQLASLLILAGYAERVDARPPRAPGCPCARPERRAQKRIDSTQFGTDHGGAHTARL